MHVNTAKKPADATIETLSKSRNEESFQFSFKNARVPSS